MTDSQPKDKRLSTISSHYDIGEKGFLNDEEKQVRAMDINGKGAVSADFAVKLATENSNFLRQIQKLNTRQLIMYAIVFTCCVATITSSIVGAERAKDTMINDQGDFVSKFNGAPVETSEALQDIGSIGFNEMTNDELADLKYISFEENTLHLAVKGHLRNKDSSVTLLIEGGTLTFDNEELISSTGETGALLETALGDSLIENAGERRLSSGNVQKIVGKGGKKNKKKLPTDKLTDQPTAKLYAPTNLPTSPPTDQPTVKNYQPTNQPSSAPTQSESFETTGAPTGTTTTSTPETTATTPNPSSSAPTQSESGPDQPTLRI